MVSEAKSALDFLKVGGLCVREPKGRETKRREREVEGVRGQEEQDA